MDRSARTAAASTHRRPMRAASTDGTPVRPTRALPKRAATSDGGIRKNKKDKGRKKKRGIRVAITVAKLEKDAAEGAAPAAAEGGEEKKEEDLKIYDLNVVCSGKYKGKPGWPDIDAFWQGQEINKDTMCDLLEQYSENHYAERKGADNLRPKRCHLQDCKMRGITYYKDFSWDPVELYLRGKPTKTVEVLESYTRQLKLQDIPWTPTTDINQVLLEQGDPSVISTLTKSKLHGHPLALAMMESETQIVVEFRGLESVVGVLGNGDETTIQETNEEGDPIWRDVKTLRTLLYDKPLPVKEGKGSNRVLEVMGVETYLKARVHYKAYFEGDVVSDHGAGLMLGERWWCHPLKDIMSGFKVENAAMIYEDIELRFYSEIGYKMDNEYFDWENQGGKWLRVKKTREP